jgi:hypothetical protein
MLEKFLTFEEKQKSVETILDAADMIVRATSE